MSRIAIVSSGDPEKDQRDIENFQRGNDRIEQGLCPNGCGGMVEIDSHNAECPRCHFGLYQAGGLNFPKQGRPQ